LGRKYGVNITHNEHSYYIDDNKHGYAYQWVDGGILVDKTLYKKGEVIGYTLWGQDSKIFIHCSPLYDRRGKYMRHVYKEWDVNRA
jgi:hypothetical protein